MVEGWLDDEDGAPQRGQKGKPAAEVGDGDDEGEEAPPTVLCARCYSLKHYGCEPCNPIGASCVPCASSENVSGR